jgi:outer membrane protein
MRTLYTGIIAAAGLLAFATPTLAQTQKIGYLDSQRIIREAPGAEQVRTQIQQEMSRFEAQFKVLSDSVDKMVADYQQKSVTLSPEQKTKREQEIRQKTSELEQRAGQLREQVGMKQDSLMKPVMERVEKVIDEIRKEEGYAIIFDVASRAMVSADTTFDITTKVITRLKASAPGPTANNNR